MFLCLLKGFGYLFVLILYLELHELCHSSSLENAGNTVDYSMGTCRGMLAWKFLAGGTVNVTMIHDKKFNIPLQLLVQACICNA